MKHKCSNVWGAPESSWISVANTKKPCSLGPSWSTTMTRIPVLWDSYCVILHCEYSGWNDCRMRKCGFSPEIPILRLLTGLGGCNTDCWTGSEFCRGRLVKSILCLPELGQQPAKWPLTCFVQVEKPPRLISSASARGRIKNQQCWWPAPSIVGHIMDRGAFTN